MSKNKKKEIRDENGDVYFRVEKVETTIGPGTPILGIEKNVITHEIPVKEIIK